MQLSRATYKFAAQGYEEFLVKQMRLCVPKYYSVEQVKPVLGQGFPIQLLTIANNIDNPGKDVIVECEVNTEKIYEWNQVHWKLAIDTHGRAMVANVTDNPGAIRIAIYQI